MKHAITPSNPAREVRRQARRLRLSDPVNAVGFACLALFAVWGVSIWWTS